MFNYISKTRFELPGNLHSELVQTPPPEFKERSDNRNPLYVQILELILSDRQAPEPIVLTAPFPAPNDQAVIDQAALDELRVRYANFNEAGYRPHRSTKVFLDELTERIVPTLPAELQKLKPRVAIQSILVGPSDKFGMWPHVDAFRTASLFYLIEGNQEETVWFEETAEIERFSFFLFGDVGKLAKAHTEMIQPGQWYVFDHTKYHCVNRTEQVQRRTSVTIEFSNITAEELYNYFGS